MKIFSSKPKVRLLHLATSVANNALFFPLPFYQHRYIKLLIAISQPCCDRFQQNLITSTTDHVFTYKFALNLTFDLSTVVKTMILLRNLTPSTSRILSLIWLGYGTRLCSMGCALFVLALFTLVSKGQNVKQKHLTKLNVACDRP